MKTIPLLVLILLILALSGCSEKLLHELEVNTSNGKTTFKTSKSEGDNKPEKCNESKAPSNSISPRSSQYIPKGKALNIKMTNISPNDSLVLSVSEQDVRITGDEPKLSTDALNEIKSKGATSNTSTENEIEKQNKALSTFLQEDEKTQQKLQEIKEKEVDYNKKLLGENKNNLFTKTGLDLLKKEVNDLELKTKNLKFEKEDAERKLDSLHFVSAINYTQNEVYQLDLKKGLIKNECQRTELLNQLKNSEDSSKKLLKELLGKEVDFRSLSSKLKQNIALFYSLKLEIENLVFEREQAFFPSKEEFTVSIKKYQRNSKTGKAEELVQLTFIQHKRFKIFSSVGMHCMIYNGKYANIYSNKDSMIVRRNGSNIVPSFGTYLNGTWRLNDCLMGIGLGIGIPLQFTSNVDMTPNFNVLWTTNFQNQYGRFGVNLGFGIQKVNVLAPGFSVGDNLGNTNPDIPLRAIWTPTFGVGISYNIGDRD